MFQVKVVEKVKKTHFMSKNNFFQKLFLLLDNVEK
jgi:hypothetical protein